MPYGRTSRVLPRSGAARRRAATLAITILLLFAGCAAPPSTAPPTVAPPAVPGDPGGTSPRANVPSADIVRVDRSRRPDVANVAGDARLRKLFHRARVLVEAESAADLSAVRLQLADDAAILAEVGLETDRLVRGQLGDGPLAERLIETLMRGQAGTYAALYSGRQRTVMVSRGVLAAYLASLPPVRAIRDEALLVLMLHELVHAADDRRHAIHENRTLDFRASFAQSAAFEGHAQWLTRIICRREGCLGGLAALDAFMFEERETDGGRSVDAPKTRASPLDRNLLEYSYVEGERFVAALAARPGGAALIERLLAEPPHDPLQILDPDSFPDVARERRNRVLLAAVGRVDHPWLTGPAARVPVPTSPLKGVNLRDDPTRRKAAIEGFTRLVDAMVAVQFHDPGSAALAPVEVTLMHTDRPDTARLFAETLHAHARASGATVIAPDAADAPALLRTSLAVTGEDAWRTAIASEGRFVVQAVGRVGRRSGSSEPLDDYVRGALAALLERPPT